MSAREKAGWWDREGQPDPRRAEAPLGIEKPILDLIERLTELADGRDDVEQWEREEKGWPPDEARAILRANGRWGGAE